MSENPYQPPLTSARVVGVKSGTRRDLRAVAKYQKGIIICIAINLLLLPMMALVPNDLLRFVIRVAYLLVAVVSTVLVFLLAIKVYSIGVGIVLGFLSLFPLIGLIVLLVVNGKATKILQQNGIKVGFLGANPRTI